MNLVTCQTCQLWTASPEASRGFAGKCKTDAWKKSYTPGRGNAYPPFGDESRECSTWITNAVMPGFVARKRA